MSLRVFPLHVLCLTALVLLAPSPRAWADEQCFHAPGIEELRAWARAARAAEPLAPQGSIQPISAAARLAAARLRQSPARETGGSVATEEGAWQPGFGLPILDEYAATAIEYRGELVVAGWLRAASQHQVRGVARWTERGWEPLGDGVIPAFALTVFEDRLIAGSWIGTVSAWNGEVWTELPPSPLDGLDALAVHEGLLVAAGVQGQRGRVATFDGRGWTVLGAEFDNRVTALGSYRGELIAGGNFSASGTRTCRYIARWDGTSWNALGAGIDSSAYAGVNAIEEYGDRLVVGGWFDSCAGTATAGLAAWDGSNWSSLAGVPAAYVEDLLVASGKLYVAGSFQGEPSSVAVWDGATWSGTAEPLGHWVLGVAQIGDRIAAVGGFLYAGGCPSMKRMVGVAMLGPDGWNGLERWDPAMHGLANNVGAGEVQSAVVYRGDVIVAGMFQLVGKPPGWKEMPGLARWDGEGWQSVGSGIWCSASTVSVVGEDLIAAGWISGNTREGPITGVGRWDGTEWHAMGLGIVGLVFALTEYQGRIYVGGEFRLVASGQPTILAVWDGIEWSAVPGAPQSARYNTPRVTALEVHDGLLYVGGNFEGSGDVHSESVIAWNGRRWVPVGGGLVGDLRALESYRGQLFAGGWLGRSDGSGWEGLFRWDGSSWVALGLEGGGVTYLGSYGSKLVVGGMSVDRFVPGSTGLVSWDGERWNGFGTGLRGYPLTACQSEGDLFVGGRFNRAGDQPSFGFARWDGSEPAPQPPGASPSFFGSVALEVRPALVTGDHALLSYSLPEVGRVRLDLFDVRGARIATLLDRMAVAGDNVLDWLPGSPAPFPGPGVYFLRLTLGARAASAKIVFAR